MGKELYLKNTLEGAGNGMYNQYCTGGSKGRLQKQWECPKKRTNVDVRRRKEKKEGVNRPTQKSYADLANAMVTNHEWI